MSDNQFNNMDDDDVRISVEATDGTSDTTTLLQNEAREQVQRRTFSHWPHSSREFIDQMVEAGFYGCNIGDRVICLKCNLVSEQWKPHIDEPREVHRIISPDCRYVQSKRMGPRPSPLPPSSLPPLPVINANLSPTVNIAQPPTVTVRTTIPFQHDEIVLKSSHNPPYAEIPERMKSFANWSNKNAPSVDDLVRAGFFYGGVRDIVTCFYCNGSICNLGQNTNPTIEHARLFPQCAYARQLCGDDLYQRIQESQRPRQGRPLDNKWAERNSGSRSDTNIVTINRLLAIPNKDTLSRLVNARLDLPISQRLIGTSFTLSVVKRCWEDQLRIKEEDFVSEYDLLIACTILQKQIERINGNRGNIIIPSVRIRAIRQLEKARSRQAPAEKRVSRHLTPPSFTNGSSYQRPIATREAKGSPDDPVPSNPCVLCLTEERQLACIPCGHSIACVPCGHSLKSCPICRREIQAFVRIYI